MTRSNVALLVTAILMTCALVNASRAVPQTESPYEMHEQIRRKPVRRTYSFNNETSVTDCRRAMSSR